MYSCVILGTHCYHRHVRHARFFFLEMNLSVTITNIKKYIYMEIHIDIYKSRGIFLFLLYIKLNQFKQTKKLPPTAASIISLGFSVACIVFKQS